MQVEIFIKMKGSVKKSRKNVTVLSPTLDSYCSYESSFETLKTKGITVIPSLLSSEECETFFNGMWKELEERIPIKQDDTSTWRSFWDLFPNHSMLLQHWQMGHTQTVWDLRQNPKIVSVFAQLWKCEPEDLLVSFDGVSFHLPSETTGRGWFKNSWFHTDQRLSDSSFQCVQGWVTAKDVNEGDATLSIFEGSHLYHEEFSKRFNYTSYKKDWYKLETQEEVDFFLIEKQCKRTCIKCPAGSLVLWDSRVFHCGQEPLSSRKEPNFRCIAYLCYLPRTKAIKKDIEKKRKYFEERRMTSHWPNRPKVFSKVPQTYGKEITVKEPERKEIQLSPLGKKLTGF